MEKSTYVDMIKFPSQGEHLGRRVKVAFNYDLSQTIEGVVIRDDISEPYHTIIKMDDDRVVLATECQYTLI